MVYAKNDGRLESENVAIKIAEAATSAKRLLMTVDDHYMYKSYFIIYRSDFQSKTEVRLIPKQVIIGSYKFRNCSKKAALLNAAKIRRKMMKLKVSKESGTGLNTEFVNIESGRKIKLEQAIRQVEKRKPRLSELCNGQESQWNNISAVKAERES